MKTRRKRRDGKKRLRSQLPEQLEPGLVAATGVKRGFVVQRQQPLVIHRIQRTGHQQRAAGAGSGLEGVAATGFAVAQLLPGQPQEVGKAFVGGACWAAGVSTGLCDTIFGYGGEIRIRASPGTCTKERLHIHNYSV